jgi:hypothetical protein
MDFDIKMAVVGTLIAASIVPFQGQLFLVGDKVNALELVDSWLVMPDSENLFDCLKSEALMVLVEI